MSLFIASLNSGSNGNCYYVGNAQEAVLIDVGLSCKELERRMKQIDLKMAMVKAIFISHEHTDHISGAAAVAKKYQLPIYVTRKTRRRWISGADYLLVDFEADVPINVGELTVVPFAKEHDAIDPHSFVVIHQATTVGVFTDIGTVCKNVIHYFKKCNAIFLEANYDEQMLEHGRYPAYLKKRITGGQGHLSNREAVELFQNHRPQFMTHVLLSHLSQENNTPELAQQAFDVHAVSKLIKVASRYEPSAVYQINSHLPSTDLRTLVMRKVKQLVMFDV